jgi:hypothetical protein
LPAFTSLLQGPAGQMPGARWHVDIEKVYQTRQTFSELVEIWNTLNSTLTWGSSLHMLSILVKQLSNL